MRFESLARQLVCCSRAKASAGMNAHTVSNHQSFPLVPFPCCTREKRALKSWPATRSPVFARASLLGSLLVFTIGAAVTDPGPNREEGSPNATMSDDVPTARNEGTMTNIVKQLMTHWISLDRTSLSQEATSWAALSSAATPLGTFAHCPEADRAVLGIVLAKQRHSQGMRRNSNVTGRSSAEGSRS